MKLPFVAEKLPDNWQLAKLEDIAKWGAGGTPKSTESGYYGGNIPWLIIGDLNDGLVSTSETKITEAGLRNSSAKWVHEGSVLVAMYGSIGKLAINTIPVTTNQAIAFTEFLPSGILNKFLFYYLYVIRNSLHSLGKGGTQKNISQTVLKPVKIPIPPYNEQHRIVAKIEELFSELDKGVESLKQAREQLKVYRQALLKHAFEGKLTEQWRKENADKLETAEQLLERIKHEREARYQQQLEEWKAAVEQWEKNGKVVRRQSKPKIPKKLDEFSCDELRQFSALPDGWQWVKFDKICEHDQYAIKAGPFGSALKKEHYSKTGYKVYGQEQVISGDPHYGNYFIPEIKYQELIACKIKPGDILISLVGTVGKVLVLPDDCAQGIINPRLIKVSANTKYYLPAFFKHYFESSYVKSLYKLQTHGATMDVLNLGIIQSLPFPFCSFEEQQEIVEKLDSALSVINQNDTEIESQIAKSEALRQSILKKAFSGQLVPQEPNDEPASALLERIAKEKAEAAATAKKGRGVKKSQKI